VALSQTFVSHSQINHGDLSLGRVFSSETGAAKEIMTVQEYRKLFPSSDLSDKSIQQQINVLAALCRHVIKHELKTNKTYEQSKANQFPGKRNCVP
jgi:hypothetical protein